MPRHSTHTFSGVTSICIGPISKIGRDDFRREVLLTDDEGGDASLMICGEEREALLIPSDAPDSGIEELRRLIDAAHHALRMIDASDIDSPPTPKELDAVCSAIELIETGRRQLGYRLTEFDGPDETDASLTTMAPLLDRLNAMKGA